MATVYNNLPGVRRKEIDLSNNLVPRIGNTVGMVVHSYKGPIKRPITITNEDDLVSVFGAPYFTSGVGVFDVASKYTQNTTVVVPDYGYGIYGAIQVLNETSSLIVVREAAVGDSYSNIGMNLQTITSATPYGITTGTSTAILPTQYNDGDLFDSPTYISTLEVSAAAFGNNIMFSHLAPSTYGNNIAVTVEVPSMSADWLYTYDEFPTVSAPVSAIWNSVDSVSGRNTVFPIASNMIKVSVFVKPSNKNWNDLYSNANDRVSGIMRIKPVEVFYGTLDSTKVDTNQNSLFIDDVINGSSQFIYSTSTAYSNVYCASAGDTNFKQPYGYDSTGAFALNYSALRMLTSGLSNQGAGLFNTSPSWMIFNNRKDVVVDLLLDPSCILL